MNNGFTTLIIVNKSLLIIYIYHRNICSYFFTYLLINDIKNKTKKVRQTLEYIFLTLLDVFINVPSSMLSPH